LAPVVLVMVLCLLTGSLAFYVAILALLVISLVASGVGLRAILRNLSPVLMLVAITFVYHIIFTDRQSGALVDVFGFTITAGGVSKAAFFSLRLLLFVTMAFLVTLTSSPSELAEAMVRLLRPLEKIRVPATELGLILFIAIRFIPILYEEFIAIRNAQAMRGVEFDGGLIKRTKKVGAIVIPVLVSAISRADELALAMEARGYRSRRPRTFYSKSRFDLTAWLFLIGSSAATFLVFYLTDRLWPS